MTVFNQPDFSDHEQVIFCSEPKSGLRAIIAIHDSTLGPAAGGCRMYPYASEADALKDVLRLSRGMTYKNALAGLPLGGGKCVVIADPKAPGKSEKLRALGQHLQSLGGRYWTAVDVGIGAADADIIAETSDYVFARASQQPADGLSTSDYTALGAFHALKATVAHVMGRATLDGVRIAVQGVGATGRELCRLLRAEGAQLVVSDVNSAAVEEVCAATGATVVPVNVIHAKDVDVFAPCALGGVLNDTTIPELKAKAVCGIANNQLAEPRHAVALSAAGIAYAPDYAVNAGGIISAGRAIFAEMNHAAALAQVEAIGATVREILERADRDDRTSAEIADKIAEERIASARTSI